MAWNSTTVRWLVSWTEVIIATPESERYEDYRDRHFPHTRAFDSESEAYEFAKQLKAGLVTPDATRGRDYNTEVRVVRQSLVEKTVKVKAWE